MLELRNLTHACLREFRENKKWRQHATQASTVDDGGRRVRVVLTGVRARVRRRPPPPPPLISKSGEPVYRVQAGLATGSEHIECCDELTQWAFRLLKNGPGNDEWRMKIERMVYKVLFEYIRKTHSDGNSDSRSGAGCSTDAEELEVVGTASSKPEGTLDNLPQLKRMAISAREALFTNVKELSAAEDFPYRNSKKQKTQHHVGDTPRAAAGDLSLIERGESAMRRSPRSLCLLKFSTFERKRVPVGPAFQADIPQWKGRSSKKWDNSDELRRLGTLILPPLLDLPRTKREEEEEEAVIRRGRPEMCGCSSPRSVLCVRSHVAQSRIELRWSLGRLSARWGSTAWAKRSLVLDLGGAADIRSAGPAEPSSDEKSFLEPALKLFGSKTRRDIVSFYFNAFVFRRMGIQTRLIGCDADSDDDEFDVEPFEDLYPRAAYRV
ncbi:unnamed protein product [Spirodela intermedia]|uniref:ELM2 domain-containing protein n=1 Tax=Spirodela intermedia TaxID=51605 RepID=A0A7I8IDI5_SPIIN|nr:unnamed protein product [Spirodela intermedia]CAA6655102.1 unnamed protein product [Spirodela intermedia]